MMQFQTRKLSIEQVSLWVVWLSEAAGLLLTLGVSPAWIGVPYTSWGFTLPLIVQVPFFFLWCLIQVCVTFFLVIQAYHAIVHKDQHVHVFANAVLICTVIQIFGFFHSLQLFGASVALTDGIFLYIYKQNERTRNMRKIVAQARAHQSGSS